MALSGQVVASPGQTFTTRFITARSFPCVSDASGPTRSCRASSPAARLHVRLARVVPLGEGNEQGARGDKASVQRTLTPGVLSLFQRWFLWRIRPPLRTRAREWKLHRRARAHHAARRGFHGKVAVP